MAKRKNTGRKQEGDVLVAPTQPQQSPQDFIDNNQNLLFYILLGAILLIGAYFAYKHLYLVPKQEEAVEQMYKAQQQFDKDSFRLALTDPGAGYPGFLDIISDYSGTEAANTANYYAGISYLHLGQYDAAIEYLEDFDATGDILPITKYGALGDAYAEKGDLEQALSYYQKAVDAGDNEILTAYYLKKVALLQEKNGNKEAAHTAYVTIRDKYPASPEAGNIEKYIFRTK